MALEVRRTSEGISMIYSGKPMAAIHRLITASALAMFALLPESNLSAAADAANGLALGRRWCASCHVVAPDQRTQTSEALPFGTIAKQPDFSASKLALFLLDPHPKMPDMGLSRAAAADLAAYIASLK
jgi:mono/diheme cytochrome c family protein